VTGRYRIFLSQPGALRLAVAGLVGRLPSGMASLIFILTIVATTGSYAAAGLAAALYTGGAAVSAPVWSRAVDRIGPRRVLVVTGLSQGAVLTVAAVVAMSGTGGAAALVVLAGLTGVVLPPLGSIMRSLWARMFSGSEVKDAAFAFESIVVDLVFIIGPSLAALLTTVAPEGVGLIAAAVVTVSGSLLLATSPLTGTVPRTGPGRRHWLGPLRHPPVLALLPVGFLLMGSIVVIELSLVAFADQNRSPGVGGLLIAVLSVGGVAGGLYWGSRRQPGTVPQQLTVLLAVLGVGWALLALPERSPWVLAVLLIVAGLALNPAITAQFSTMEEIAPDEAMTESFGWLNAVASAGAAVAATVTGLLVRTDPSLGFLLAAGMCATAFVIALLMQRTWLTGRPVAEASAATLA
jgi:MFS family permease